MKGQSDDMAFIWGKGEIETKLDYVICWYKKAMDYIKGTTVIKEQKSISFQIGTGLFAKKSVTKSQQEVQQAVLTPDEMK